jgi:hypothetical protein
MAVRRLAHATGRQESTWMNYGEGDYQFNLFQHLADGWPAGGIIDTAKRETLK